MRSPMINIGVPNFMLIFKTRKEDQHSLNKILVYYERQRVISAIKKM